MFDREQFITYVGEKSGSSYASGLAMIESAYAVDIDAAYAEDQCAHLLRRIEADKQNAKTYSSERKNFSNMISHLKRYITYKSGNKVIQLSAMRDDGYWPSLTEFNPELTKEDWKRFILDQKKAGHSSTIQMLKAMLASGGEASCKKLADDFGGHSSRYVGCAINLGKRVKKYFNLPTCLDQEQERYFVYPFFGRHLSSFGENLYSYRLRPELMAALQELKLSDVSPYVAEEVKTMTELGLNTILYGPPGTGKTYHTVIYAVAIVENRPLASVTDEDYEAVLARYKEYKEQGRIEFTTFHQSFGYEEFIEGIRPSVSSEEEEGDSGEVRYSVQPGIFKRFCERADGTTFDKAWSALIAAAAANGEQLTFRRRTGSEITASLRDEDSFLVKWQGKTQSQNVLRKTKVFEQWSDPDPKRRTHLSGGSVWEFDAIQAVIDMMVHGYHLPVAKADVQTKENYVFIIDEINRGNISKIFGELITLLEDSKRIGKPEGMTVRLPYSQKLFGVPDNVHIIGTMNTADRSIATIDTALRRRFTFREMLPNPQVLGDVMVEDLSIGAMLSRMNRRIAVLYDREHTIGHAYFMKLREEPTVEKLAEVFRNNIIPLLQEYFYEDYEKIRLVLGDPTKSNPDTQFITACENHYVDLFGSADVGLDDSVTYEINNAAFENLDSYRSI